MCSVIERLKLILPVLLLAVSLSACKDDISDLAMEQKEDKAGLLRFGVKGSTRTIDSGVKSEFENGDRIGCVIAFRNAVGDYEYQATTCWTYNSANGMLVLERVYSTTNGMCEWHDANRATDLICRHPDYDTDKGFVQLNTAGKQYCFFFYYPFISGADTDAAFNELAGKDGVSAYDLKIPFSGFALDLHPNWDTYWYNQNKSSFVVTGLPDFETRTCTDGSKIQTGEYNWADEKHNHYNWKSFPCFASIAQGSRPQQSNSNFMWVSYVMDQKDPSKPVTPEDVSTHYTVGLQFRKKMAAIDLVIDDPAILTTGGLYYRNIPEEKNVSYGDANTKYDNYFMIGRQFDLSTGKFSDYPQYRAEWQCANAGIKQQEYAAVFASYVSDAYEDNGKNAQYNRVRPCPLGGGVFRVILPPQESFKCELHFSKNGKDYAINLYSRIPMLKENTLYTIRLMDAGDWSIVIRDWTEGENMLIEEND